MPIRPVGNLHKPGSASIGRKKARYPKMRALRLKSAVPAIGTIYASLDGNQITRIIAQVCDCQALCFG